MKIKAELKPGKVALVTGGSSGIGKAIACGLAERGMHVWLIAQRTGLLNSALKEVETHRQNPDQKIATISADVSDLDQVHAAVNQVNKTSGLPDLLVNSAGVTHPGYIENLNLDIFDWMMETNYFGTVYMTKEVLPGMLTRGSGYILNISSFAGLVNIIGYTAYGASKAAVRGLTDALRQEMKSHGIGVSIIFPSDTDTPQLAYENQFKPLETRALGSTDGVMSAEYVAQSALRGIERGQYYIIPTFEGRLIYRLSGILPINVVNFVIDQIITNSRKKDDPSKAKKE